jgi:hypothetical protein
MSKYQAIDLGKIKTSTIKNRKSKVRLDQLAAPHATSGSFTEFWKSLPASLAVNDLRTLVDRIASARQNNKPVMLMMGAHVIKVGLNPILVDLMHCGVIQGIAFNGACAIHDTELAYFGTTSEDVAEALKDGSFGMAGETASLLNEAARRGSKEELGFGEALGKRIVEDRPPHAGLSILGEAFRLNIPVTVHVAVGTDIVHQHPSADGASIGDVSHRDFKIWSNQVSRIGDGGVVLLFGSSVILPEVFLKALTVARNINGKIENFTTANFDMIRHYRPRVNVVERPTESKGSGYDFVGHHEIMIPLLAAAIKEKLNLAGAGR